MANVQNHFQKWLNCRHIGTHAGKETFADKNNFKKSRKKEHRCKPHPFFSMFQKNFDQSCLKN